MLIVYVYDQTDTVVAQFMKAANFQCRTLINDIGTASFELDSSEERISYANLEEFKRHRVAFVTENKYGIRNTKVYDIMWDDSDIWDDSDRWMEYTTIRETYLISRSEEKTIFDGVVRESTAIPGGLKVTLNDFFYLLKKKKLYTDKTYTGIAVNVILGEILDEINARYNSGISLSSDVTTLINAQYKAFISYFDVLKDLAEGGYEFSMTDKVLTFTQKIGIDRTADPNYVQFKHDITVPQEINISDYSIRRDSENFSNAPTATSSGTNTTLTDPGSIIEYGRIEEVYAVDGNVEEAAQANLDNRSQSVSEVSVTPATNDFFIADIGDTVDVFISGETDMHFFSGDMRVIEKGLRYSGATQEVDIQLSVNKVFTPTLLDTIKNLRERVKKLEV